MRTGCAVWTSGHVLARLEDESHHPTRREQHNTSSAQEEHSTWTKSSGFWFPDLALERRRKSVSGIGMAFLQFGFADISVMA